MSYISGGGGGGAIAVPVTVPNGGTGLITITDHAVMVGSGVAAVTPVGPGNTNQVFIGNTGADPSWGTVPNAGLTNSSITLANGNNINITGSPVSLGGTATVNVSGTTQYAIQVGDATGSLDSLGIGLAGQVMQSSGAGVNPAWTTATYPATTAQGDVIYSSAANVVDSLAKSAVATRYIANTGAGNNPQWDQINLANGVTGILTVPNGGTGLSTITDHGILLGSGAGAITPLGVATDGQIPIGSTGIDPVLATITAGANISVVNAGGSITIASTAAGGPEFADNLFRVIDNGDNSKKLAFECSVITGATTRTITMMDQDLDLTTPVFPGLVTASAALTVTTGDATISAGNLNLPSTNAALTQGVIEINSVRMFHAYGTRNVFIGESAGNGTLSGAIDSIAIGARALDALTSGDYNVGIGTDALGSVTTGAQNIGIGTQALFVCADGHYNMAIGINSLVALTSGERNACIGTGGLGGITTGDYNIGMGDGAGNALTTSDSDNICISSPGASGDNNVIRIGTQGTGDKQQNNCFIAGIHGVTPSGATQTVIIDANGELGSTAAGGGGISWSEVTGTSQTMATDTGYITNNAGLVTCTLPTTAAVGKVVRVCGKGAGGWKIAQNAGESIIWDESTSTTVGVGGSLASTDDYDSVELLCTVADTTWTVLSSKGNVTVV